MVSIPTKNTGDTLTAVEFNQLPDELENAVTDSGQTPAAGVVDQVSRAMANYAGNAGFYLDSGGADAYILTAASPFKGPTAYADGLEIRFRPGNANTGASTVNVNSLGVKSIKKADGSTDPDASDLNTAGDFNARYDGTNFRIVLRSTLPAASETVQGIAEILTQPATDAGTDDERILTILKWKNSVYANTELIATVVASNDVTIEFTSRLDEFRGYILKIEQLIPTTDNVTLQQRISQDGGSTFLTGAADYEWVFITVEPGSDDPFSDPDDNQMDIINSLGTAPGENAKITLHYPELSNTTLFKPIRSEGVLRREQGGGEIGELHGGMNFQLNTGLIDGLQFYMSAGNISSGTFKLYGVL